MKSKIHYFSLIFQRSVADLTLEARRGYLGILWWIIEPIMYMLVFYLIFVVIFNRGGENQVDFLLTGLVVWKWFNTAIPNCANCISANAGLIRQVYIPKLVFPSMVIMTSTMKFLIIFFLLVLFLMIKGTSSSVAWVSLPILMGVQLLAMLAIGSVLAAIVPFLPDLKMIIDNGMILLFFLSGVFFDISVASPEIKMYLHLNPMAGIIENYRTVLLDGAWPDWFLLSVISSLSLLGLIFGRYLLQRFDGVYAKII